MYILFLQNFVYKLNFYTFAVHLVKKLISFEMYAIVEIAGQQFKVEKDRKVFVHQLEGNEGENVEFDRVLLIDNEGKIQVGKPTVKDAKVTAKILMHQRGDKVIVFKKKRRKGYQKRNGHRQYFTQIQIEEIVA